MVNVYKIIIKNIWITSKNIIMIYKKLVTVKYMNYIQKYNHDI
jgi:hypothetical protein